MEIPTFSCVSKVSTLNLLLTSFKSMLSCKWRQYKHGWLDKRTRACLCLNELKLEQQIVRSFLRNNTSKAFVCYFLDCRGISFASKFILAKIFGGGFCDERWVAKRDSFSSLKLTRISNYFLLDLTFSWSAYQFLQCCLRKLACWIRLHVLVLRHRRAKNGKATFEDIWEQGDEDPDAGSWCRRKDKWANFSVRILTFQQRLLCAFQRFYTNSN